MRFEAQVRIPVRLRSSGPERCGADFSAKRRMRPAGRDCFPPDSLNAFILRFAGVWRFFYFHSSALVSQSTKTARENFSAGQLKDQYMKQS